MSDFYNKYPYTDFHELNLDWVIERVKKLTEDWAETLTEWHNTQEEWNNLYNYVHDYFDNLNVQEEINIKINAMVADGTFADVARPIILAALPDLVTEDLPEVVATQIDGAVAGQIDGAVALQIDDAVVNPVNEWLNDHITQPTTPAIDTSLSIAGAAADAEAVGAIQRMIVNQDDSIIVTGKNKFDKSRIVEGYYYYNNEKRINVGTCYYKAYLTPGETYFVSMPSGNIWVQHYTNEGDTGYISSAVVNAGNSFTVPATALYTYVSTYTSSVDYLQIEEGSSGTTIEDFEYLLKPGYNIIKKIYSRSDSIIAQSINEYNKNDIVEGYYYYNGSKRTLAGTCYYKAHLKAGEEYVVSLNPSAGNIWIEHYAFENDTGYISSAIKNNGDTFTVPANALYTYISCYMGPAVDTLQVEQGNSPSSYIPFGYYFNPGMHDDDLESLKTLINDQIHYYTVSGSDKLGDIIAEAVKYKNSVVYIKKDIDIIDELGSTFIENYTYPGSDGYLLSNGIHLIFDTDVKVTCNYTGENSDFITYYSVFATYKGDSDNSFTIENMHLEFSNIRYGIHDELVNRAYKGIHVIKNCIFDCGNRPAIGCGSGLACTYIYDNLIIDNGSIFWHQSILGSGICELTIKNCYVEDGIDIYVGGSGIVNTNALICNNDIPAAIILNYTTGYSENNGLRLIDFNNHIR